MCAKIIFREFEVRLSLWREEMHWERKVGRGRRWSGRMEYEHEVARESTGGRDDGNGSIRAQV